MPTHKMKRSKTQRVRAGTRGSALPGPVFYAEGSITPALHRRLIRLLTTCFRGPNDASFRVQSYWREPPTWRWILFDRVRPIAQVTVHDVTVSTRKGPRRVGAVGDVCVHPDYRGRGYVRAMLAEAHAWLRGEGIGFTFLTGNPAVYSSSGYEAVRNRIRHYDPVAKTWREEPVKNAMARALTDEPWPGGRIDWGGQFF